MPTNRLPAKAYLGFMPPAQEAGTDFVEGWLGGNEGAPPGTAHPVSDMPFALGQDVGAANTPWAAPATVNQAGPAPGAPAQQTGHGGTWDVGQPVPPMPPGQLPEGFKWGIGSATMPTFDAQGLPTGQKIVFFWEPKEAAAAAKPNVVTRNHVDEQGNTWEQDYIINPDGSMTPVPNMSARLIELAAPYDPNQPDEPEIYTETSWDDKAQQSVMRQFVYDMGPDGNQIKRYISSPVPTGPRQDIDLSRERFEWEQKQDLLAQQNRLMENAAEQAEAQKGRAWQSQEAEIRRQWEDEQAAKGREYDTAQREADRAQREKEANRAYLKEMFWDPVLKYIVGGGYNPWETATGQAQAPPSGPKGTADVFMFSEAGRKQAANRMWQAGLTAPGGTTPYIDIGGQRKVASDYTPEQWQQLLREQRAVGNIAPSMPETNLPWYMEAQTNPEVKAQAEAFWANPEMYGWDDPAGAAARAAGQKAESEFQLGLMRSRELARQGAEAEQRLPWEVRQSQAKRKY